MKKIKMNHPWGFSYSYFLIFFIAFFILGIFMRSIELLLGGLIMFFFAWNLRKFVIRYLEKNPLKFSSKNKKEKK